MTAVGRDPGHFPTASISDVLDRARVSLFEQVIRRRASQASDCRMIMEPRWARVETDAVGGCWSSDVVAGAPVARGGARLARPGSGKIRHGGKRGECLVDPPWLGSSIAPAPTASASSNATGKLGRAWTTEPLPQKLRLSHQGNLIARPCCRPPGISILFSFHVPCYSSPLVSLLSVSHFAIL